MRRYCFALTLACVGLTAGTGCNSILGNDDGFLPDKAGEDGSAALPGVMSPGASTDTQDETDAGADWDAFVPAAESPDSSTGDAGARVDAGTVSTQDAGSPKDAGACSGKLVRCGLLCVDLQNDALHCGNCATICLAPPTCQDGHCKKP